MTEIARQLRNSFKRVGIILKTVVKAFKNGADISKHTGFWIPRGATLAASGGALGIQNTR